MGREVWDQSAWHVILANFLHIHPGLLIMIMTIVVIFGYMGFFFLLTHLTLTFKENWEDAEGSDKILWFIPFALVGLVFVTLHVIHLLLTIGAAKDTLRNILHDRD